MLQFLKREANRTRTENGAATYKTTFSYCLDLFATVGALRHADAEDILRRFIRAFTENSDLAMKILFYARDVRGGLGERRVFRICMKWLAEQVPVTAHRNLIHIAEYGRWDDLLCLLDTPCEQRVLSLIKAQLEVDLLAMKDGREVSLLAKWLPSVNASNPETVLRAKRVARFLGMRDSDYRKTLTALRQRIRIIENDLRERDYSFDYSKQPSRAMFKYRRAFYRNDRERYEAFLYKAARGEAKLHADTLMPYELVEPYLGRHFTANSDSFMLPITEEERTALNATWAALPKFTGDENALAVVDTSGSMYLYDNPKPASVALSLGLYFAEHNTGAFKDHFIEFSDDPRLIEVKGDTFADRLRYIASFNEVGSTSLESVFDLILDAAVKNHVPQEELPATLYIISDMEFNACVEDADASNFESAKAKYACHGYRLPKIVFWNVQSRNLQQPVTRNEQGVALVSGCTPRIFSLLAKERLSPFDYMMEVLGAERYAPIAA